MSDQISSTSGLDHSHHVSGTSSASVKKSSIKQSVPRDTVEISKTHQAKDIAKKPNTVAVSEVDVQRYVTILKEMGEVSARDIANYEQEVVSKTAEGIARDLGFSV
jgi:hypothetical protein